MNFKVQFYRGLALKLIKRNYNGYKAKRYTINGTNQNIWIPNKHLEEDGTIKPKENIDYILNKAKNQIRIARGEI